MAFLTIKNNIRHLVVIGLITVGLLGGYYLVGKDYPFIDFAMRSGKNIEKPFMIWLLFFAIIQCLIIGLLKKEDIFFHKNTFNLKTIWVVVLLFVGALFLERHIIYQFWEPMRIDYEQHMWVAIGRNLNDFWVGKTDHRNDAYSIWAGHYNSFHGFFIAVVNYIVLIDSWGSYKALSVAVMGVSTIPVVFILNKWFGKPAVLFFIATVIFSAYMNFASFYMKHHIFMLFFYAIIMWLVFNYWKKSSILNVLFLSAACFWAFVAYIGCIYYLPIAAVAVLLAHGKITKKIIYSFVVSAPTLALLVYLMVFPDAWPSSYFVNKGVWKQPEPLGILWDNTIAELKFMLIPAGIWGWIIQACFIVGVAYIIKSRQKETWVWLFGLLMGFAAMLTSWDREMGHNFIMILPYAVIASFGAAQLWNVQFSFAPFAQYVYKGLFAVGFCCDLYAFALSERWLNLAVFDLAVPLNNRVWFFDDARKLEKFGIEPIVIDSSLVNQIGYGIQRFDTALTIDLNYAHHFSDFAIYKKAVFLSSSDEFPKTCQGVLLTDKTLEQAQLWLGEGVSLALLDKYRPANPRYDFISYQPDVFHAIYQFRFASQCKS